MEGVACFCCGDGGGERAAGVAGAEGPTEPGLLCEGEAAAEGLLAATAVEERLAFLVGSVVPGG